MPGDYISKSALLKQLESDDSLKHARKLIHIYVEEAPTTAVEPPVVHCGECKWRTEAGNCGHPRQEGILPTAYPLDFCSYGEQKDNPLDKNSLNGKDNNDAEIH